ITVERIEEGKPPETRPLRDALGFDNWLMFAPASDRRATFSATDQAGARNGIRYVLHVPGDRPALVGTSAADVERAQQPLAAGAGAVEAMRRLDDYAARLAQVFGPESGIVGHFADTVRPVEESWLTASGDPGALVTKHIDAFVNSLREADARET